MKTTHVLLAAAAAAVGLYLWRQRSQATALGTPAPVANVPPPPAPGVAIPKHLVSVTPTFMPPGTRANPAGLYGDPVAAPLEAATALATSLGVGPRLVTTASGETYERSAAGELVAKAGGGLFGAFRVAAALAPPVAPRALAPVPSRTAPTLRLGVRLGEGPGGKWGEVQ